MYQGFWFLHGFYVHEAHRRLLKYGLFVVLGTFFLLACQSPNLNGQSSKKNTSSSPDLTKSTDPVPPKKPSKECDLNSGSAVVLMYHRFDAPYESTSISMETFVQQMEFFKTEGYRVVSLKELVSALQNRSLPSHGKWVALTIDDAYKSFLKARPVLETYQYPYTIFVNTEAVEKQYASSMTWEDLKQIASSRWGTLSAHSHTHGHLLTMTPEQRKKDILLSVELIHKNTGVLPEFFSYPFGEVSQAFLEEIKGFRFEGRELFLAGFATQSGPVGCSSDIFSLPRFAMNEKYGTVDDLFKIKIQSRHLPVYDYHPRNKALCLKEKRDKIYFSTLPDIDLSRMQCYSNRGHNLNVSAGKGMVTVSLDRPLGFGVEDPVDVRERINCTVGDKKGRYFWYGREFALLKDSEECKF